MRDLGRLTNAYDPNLFPRALDKYAKILHITIPHDGSTELKFYNHALSNIREGNYDLQQTASTFDKRDYIDVLVSSVSQLQFVPIEAPHPFCTFPLLRLMCALHYQLPKPDIYNDQNDKLVLYWALKQGIDVTLNGVCIETLTGYINIHEMLDKNDVDLGSVNI